jgi:hypothetical protein
MSRPDPDPVRDAALDPWLSAARADLAQRTPPAWIEAQLLARAEEQRLLQSLRREAPARPRSRPARRWLRWLALPVAAAAALLLALALPARTAPDVVPNGASFIALAPLDEIAAERGTVLVPGQVPRAQLADFGLPVDPARADQPARADFLLSSRGVVLAVRFVQ